MKIDLRDRHFSTSGCRPLCVLGMLCGLLMTGSAMAEISVQIDTTSSATVAPALVTLDAVVDSDQPVIAYRWSGLGVAPRCNRPRCELPVQVASCRRVEVEATNLLGESATAVSQVCVSNDLSAPPQVELQLTRQVQPMGADGETETTWQISQTNTAGSDPIVVERIWVDDELTSENSFVSEGGCHAVDALVADGSGRIGISQHTVCTSEDAPRVWLGSTPGPHPDLGERFELCGENEHPLGLEIRRTFGVIPLSGCRSSQTPQGFDRIAIAGIDDNGTRSFASTLVASAVPGATRTTVFVIAPEKVVTEPDAPAQFNVQIIGGDPPYTVRGGNDVVFADGPLASIELSSSRTGTVSVEIEVTDVRDRSDRVSLDVVFNSSAGAAPGLSSADAACRHTRLGGSRWPPVFVVLGLLLFARRRRR